MMRYAVLGSALLILAVAVPATGQNSPAAPAIVRTVVAAGKLPDVVAAPLYFRADTVILSPNATSRVSAPNGILYQLSGSTVFAASGESKTLGPGDAMLLPTGVEAVLTAGRDGSSRILFFVLTTAALVDSSLATAPATVAELYRTPAAIPDLKTGSYDLNLTRVTFPPQMPSNPPHHRSGAALYYILSGTGANTIAGTTTDRGPGSLIYEPSGLVHQWGNPGGEPLTFIAFNINPEGTPAVVPEPAPK
jgi:mannose-6-phosphate isomerase-like protein (cupin superfamily)